MRRRLQSRGLVGLLGLIVMLGAASSSSAASPPTWGNATDVPGIAALNSGGYATMNSVSCAVADYCTAGGEYEDGSGNTQAFVVDETNGTWGTAIEVPGTATLNSGGAASVNSVSCATAGNCAAGGTYIEGSGKSQAFVVDETSGSWGNAIEVPGTAALNVAGYAIVNTVSCATAGNCAAGGTYIDGSGHSQAFVVDETNGSWGNAIEVPGTAALNGFGAANTISVSCATAGNCTAGGFYRDSSNHDQAFVADETSGTWGSAIEVPGTATLNSGGAADTISISCATAGNCTAGGYYRDSSKNDQAFVAEETSGTWGSAIEVPGTAALNTGGTAIAQSVSCATAANCAAGGSYIDANHNVQAFVADKTGGSWGNAIKVPGTATLNTGGAASVNSISCATATECAAVGTYIDGSGNGQAYVVDKTNGVWGNAIEVPGTAALNNGHSSDMRSVSCGTAGSCSAGGSYYDGARTEAFIVVSVSSSRADQTILVSKHAPASAVYGTGFTVAATGGGSGKPVTYSSSGGCTNVGASFTMTSGTTACTVMYDQAGNSSYNPAAQVTETVIAQKAAQTISVTTHAPATAVYGTSFGVSATAPGGTVSFSSASGCSNVGATFTMTTGTGTCSVRYDNAGNSNYSAAPQVTESVTGQKASQSITFAPIPGHAYSDSDFAPGATASSGLTVSYGASGNCTIVSGKAHLTGKGSCTVTASQAGNANYTAAVDAQQSFSIGKAALTITASDQQKVFQTVKNLGTTAFTTSGLVGSDSISAVTLTSAGTSAGAAVGNYPIVPSAAVAGIGDLSNYTITYVNGNLQVTKFTQSINFPPLSDRTWGDADFDPGATASSGLTVSYGASGNCTMVGGLVHLTSAGSCTVTASQGGDSNYGAAPDVQQSFTIDKSAVTVTATNQQKLRHQTLTLGTTAFTASALVGSDSISTVTLTSAGADASAAAGNYPIVPSAAVAGSGTDLNNYAIDYVNGTLDVLNAGLVGLNGVSVSTKSGTIDSFDSSHGAYKGSNHGSAALVLSNGAVSLAGVAVSGDVTGDPVSISGSAHVNGLVTQAAPSPPIAAPTVARCSKLSKKSGIRGGKFKYSARSGNLTVKRGTVKLANGTYCFNNVKLAPRSKLSVSGQVTIHLRGKLSGKGQLVNTTNKPGNLHIDTSSTHSNAIAIAGNSRAYMTIVAPGTTATISSGSFFGTLLAGTVKLTGKTTFHTDMH